MKGVNLKVMTVDALLDLRDNIDRILSTKVAATGRELNSKLRNQPFLATRQAAGEAILAKEERSRQDRSGRRYVGRWGAAAVADGAAQARKIEEFATPAATARKPAAALRRPKRVRSIPVAAISRRRRIAVVHFRESLLAWLRIMGFPTRVDAFCIRCRNTQPG